MLATMLALAAAAPSLDAIDEANLALTTCGFAAYREADAQDQLLDQFKRTLNARCARQMASMRKLTLEFQVARHGLARNAAARAADGLISRFKAHFANQYSNRAQTKAQLEALGRAIQQEKEKSNSR